MKSVRSALVFGLVATLFSTQAYAFCFLPGNDLCAVSCHGETDRITSELVKSSSPNDTVCALAMAADGATLDALLKAGVDVNARTKFGARNAPAGRNALFRVINSDSSDIFEVLMANKIDVNVQDRLGKTPLMEAAWGGRDRMVEELLKAGALPNVKDKGGETALCYAQRLFVRNQDKIIDMLKNAGGTCEQ